MRPFASRRAPPWLVGLVAVVLAGCLRLVGPALLSSGGAGAHDGSPSLAFFAIFVLIAEAIWKGVEVAGRVALAILQYSVHILWRVATLLAKGAGELARYTWKGLKRAWDLLRLTYDKALKPAFRALVRWTGKTWRWLKHWAGNVRQLLVWLRDHVLCWYDTYVKPWLDLIDVTRSGLRLLGSLGLDWAKTLDARLGQIEDLITSKYLEVLGYINQAIDVINSVVGKDGLFQRLAFIKTLARDYKQAWNELMWGYHKPIGAKRTTDLQTQLAKVSLAVVAHDLRAYLKDGSGDAAETMQAVSVAWHVYLGFKY